MTIKLIEGWDHMGTVNQFISKGWNPITASGGGSKSIIAGRIAGNALRITENATSSNIDAMQKVLPSTYTQFVCGFAFRTTARPTQTTEFMVFTTSTTATVRMCQNTSGNLVVLNSSGSGVTSANVLSLNTWYYLEIKIVINGASGSVATQLNGITDISTTTVNFGSSAVDSVYAVGGTYPGGSGLSHFAGSLDYDDIYFLDTSGSPNNNYLGDVVVETIYPSAAGAHTQWAPNSGVVNFNRVNEHTVTYPDDDTTYVFDTVVNDRDSYAFDDLPSLAGTVYALQTDVYARKDDAGLKQICAVARPSSTDRDGATITLGLTYSCSTEIRETNPDTSAAWTIADVNGAEFGVKVVT